MPSHGLVKVKSHGIYITSFFSPLAVFGSIIRSVGVVGLDLMQCRLAPFRNSIEMLQRYNLCSDFTGKQEQSASLSIMLAAVIVLDHPSLSDTLSESILNLPETFPNLRLTYILYPEHNDKLWAGVSYRRRGNKGSNITGGDWLGQDAVYVL